MGTKVPDKSLGPDLVGDVHVAWRWLGWEMWHDLYFNSCNRDVAAENRRSNGAFDVLSSNFDQTRSNYHKLRTVSLEMLLERNK